MKLRSKFVLAFGCLAVAPLAYIVVHSYETSLAAYRSAVEAESQAMVEEMNTRMSQVRTDLDNTLARATHLRMVSLHDPEGRTKPENHDEIEQINRELKEVAPLIEACEFIPALPCPDQGAAIPAPAPVAPADAIRDVPGRIVFDVDWLRVGAGEASTPTVAVVVEDGGEDAPEAAWLDALLAEGAKVAQALAENPDRADEIIAEHGGDLGKQVVGVVIREGPEIFARAMADPEGLEESLNQQALEVVRRIRTAIPTELRLTEEELAKLEMNRQLTERILGRRYSYEVRDGEQILGTVHAQIRASEVLQAVLSASRREHGEVPFAVDAVGQLYTLSDGDTALMSELREVREKGDATLSKAADWVLAETTDPQSGTTFGIAKPLGQGLAEIRRTAARNMALGMLVVAVAGVVIWPLSHRMTRHLSTLTDAAEALARGELATRVQVRSRDEIGTLAATFNHMAEELSEQRTRLVAEEQRRREQEVGTRLLELENRRQTEELEAARQFQLSLLPDTVPEHPDCVVAVAMRTATEVGGDYYDFRTSSDGALVIALGDATGHGAAAGTMVTVAKSLFTAAHDLAPAAFLDRAATVIRTMRLGRMSMALAVARLAGHRLTLAMAGMPPVLVHRRELDHVEEVLIPGMPLGGFKSSPYRSVEIPMSSGDTVLMMSDGFPELLDETDHPMGYERARRHFADLATASPQELIAGLEERAKQWRKTRAQADDMTFLVIRCRA